MKILVKFFSKNILSIQKKVITLHSQLSADGAIAQLVEQGLKILVSPVRFLVAPQNRSYDSVTPFFVPFFWCFVGDGWIKCEK